MYQYHNNILCVPAKTIYSDLALITYDTYKKQCNRGKLLVVRRACMNRIALLSYDALPDNFKQVLFEKYGPPYPIVITLNK
jgi:hypothetical protein